MLLSRLLYCINSFLTRKGTKRKNKIMVDHSDLDVKDISV